MGTGWNYFNNVCEALRVAIGVCGVALGLLAITGGWWGVSQYMQRANPDALPAVAATDADPNGSAAPAVSNAAPTAPPVAPAVTAPARSNAVAAPPSVSNPAQPAAPGASRPAASAGSHSDFYHQNARPNPQFSGGGNK